MITGLSGHSGAKEYSAQTVLRAGGEYDDNVQLTEEEIAVIGVVVSPEFNFGVRTERLDLSLDTALDFARFDKSGFNSDDQDVRLISAYAFEYDVFNASAQLKRDSTRTSETLDTGVVGLQADRREAENLTLAWQHLFTEKHSVQLSASYSDVENQSVRLSDYDYSGLNALYTFVVSDRIRLTTQLSATRFKSDTFGPTRFGVRELGINCVPEPDLPFDPNCPLFVPTEIRQDSYGLNFGMERDFTKTVLFSIAVGANYVESDFDSQQADIFSQQSGFDLVTGLESEDDIALFLSTSLRYKGERTTLNLSLSSNTNPSSYGYLSLSNQISFNGGYRLTERSDLFARFVLIDSESLGDVVNASLQSNDRTYGSVSVGFSYMFTEKWFVEASYRYRAQNREVFEDIAKSNTAFLDVVYKPQKNTWSR